MSYFITPDQLRIGLYVQLDLGWTGHPFAFNSFKIKSQEQIDILQRLNLTQIRYDPSRSTAKPLDKPPQQASLPAQEEEIPQEMGEQRPPNPAKLARLEQLKDYRSAVARAETALIHAVHEVRDINANVLTRPSEALAQADAFIGSLAETFLNAPEATIHAMGGRVETQELYQHGLNVVLLSLIMAKGNGMGPEQGRILGMGALFHDIGLKEVPSRILRKTEPLSDAENHLRQMHCDQGAKIGKHIGLPEPVLAIIRQHHEAMDGSGYPKGLKGDQIDPLARIVEVANRFDTLCNPLDASRAMSPHYALSWMFAQQRAKHDPRMMRVLIRCLGVYPPGTAVHLSNGATALVASVNPERPLKPMLVVYDPEVPREEAIMVDLEQESDINIVSAIKPNELPRSIRDYLSMRKHVSYYFDEGTT